MYDQTDERGVEASRHRGDTHTHTHTHTHARKHARTRTRAQTDINIQIHLYSHSAIQFSILFPVCLGDGIIDRCNCLYQLPPLVNRETKQVANTRAQWSNTNTPKDISSKYTRTLLTTTPNP